MNEHQRARAAQDSVKSMLDRTLREVNNMLDGHIGQLPPDWEE